MPSDRDWIRSLPPDLGAQREAVEALLEFCEHTSLVTSLSVGCSLGRNAADALSDVDAAIGVRAASGSIGERQVRVVDDAVVALLPTLGGLVGALRLGTTSGGLLVRRVFAQFDDRLQLDLAVVAEEGVRRGQAAPDFVSVYWTIAEPSSTRGPSAYQVRGEQVQQWEFLGWRALLDADKYLQRGALWEAHARLHEARDLIWRLWATAKGASYPWHGLSQVFDHDPDRLPPGIDGTVARLEHDDLRRALAAAVEVLEHAGLAAEQRCQVRADHRMARFVRSVIASVEG